MKSVNLTILLFFYFFLSFGQAPSQNEIKFDELIQELVQQQEEGISYEDMYESLMQYFLEPIDLNKATREELQQLFILSPLQINIFLEYRKSTGTLLSIYELQSIPSFDEATIQKIIPFVKINSSEENVRNIFKNLFTNSNHYLLIRSGKGLGQVLNQDYQGDGNKILVRYKNSKPRNFSYGFSLEKDEGEKNQWAPNRHYYGTDFLSYHLTLYNKGNIKAFSIGDYQMQFGQGLVLSTGFRLGKGSETILTVKKNNAGIKPYNSTLEYGFFRGSAVTIVAGPVDFTAFYSYKNIDGNLKGDSSFSPVFSGYHRNVQELSKRNNINEQIAGTNISFQNKTKNFHSGFTFVNTHYNYCLQKTPSTYNSFEFSGNNNFTTGADFTFSTQNIILFGESAISQSGGKGIVTGFLSSLSKELEISMLYRNYERNFQSFYSNSFGENSENINEKGIYWGLKLKLNSRWIFSCYYDRFKFPWLKFLVTAPSQGDEYLGNLSFRPNKNTALSIQFRQENKERNLVDNLSAIDYPVECIKRNFIFRFETKATSNLTLRSRLQMSSYKQAQTTFGYAIMNDLDVNIRPFIITLRYALFETDDYDNRQYVYEKDVLYSFSIPAYYGKGTRFYAVAKCKIFKNLDTWIRYSRTSYMNMLPVEENNIPSKSDIRIQAIYSF